MAKRARKRSVSVRQRSNRNLYIILGAVALGVAGLALILALNLRGEQPIRGLVTIPGLPRGHDNTLEFAQTDLPPAGGVHYDTWLNCGIYTEPVESGHAIHSLEHGAVWVTYQPNLDGDEIDYLHDLVRDESYVLMSPYPGQRSPVVLTAWGLQLEVDSARDRRVAEFVERYQLGPQTPERGASCRNGAGTPMSSS